MKCSNCGEELNDGTVFCPHCGAKVEAQENVAQEPIQEVNEPITQNVAEENESIVEEPVQQPVETVNEPVMEQYTEPVQQSIEEPVMQQNVAQQPIMEQPVMQEPVQQPAVEEPSMQAAPQAETKVETKSNNKRPSIITLVAIIAAIVLVGIIACVLLFGSKSPEKIYKGLIKEAINTSIAGESALANSANITTGFSISTNIDEVEEMMDGLNANVNVQYDRAAQQAVVAADVKKGTDNFLNLKAMADLKEKYAVVGEDNLFSKLVKVDIPDEFYDEMKEYLGDNYTFEVDAKRQKTIANKINAAAEKYMKAEWFSKEKVATEIDGKTKKVTDNCMKITGPELTEYIKNVVVALRMDNEFLNCFDKRDEVIEVLDQIEDSAEDFDDEDMTYTIHLFTGSMNKFMGLAMVQRDEYYEDEDIIEVVKKSEKQYEIDIEQNYYGEVEVLQKIIVDINKNSKKEKDFTVNVDVEDEGYIKVNVNMSEEYNKSLQLLDAASAVKYEELSEDDMQEIYDNLEKSPLYDYISAYTKVSTPTTDGRELPKGVTISQGENFVLSYDDDVIIFEVPNSLEYAYSGNSYLRYTKEDKSGKYANIDVECNYDTIKTFEESLDYYKKSYEDDEDYIDVKLSDAQKIEVDGRTYFKRDFTYTYDGSYSKITRKYTYYYTEINDEYVYSVEVSDDDGIVTDSEIEKLLTITVKLAD